MKAFTVQPSEDYSDVFHTKAQRVLHPSKLPQEAISAEEQRIILTTGVTLRKEGSGLYFCPNAEKQMTGIKRRPE